MKLVVGALRDFKSAGSLATELIVRGCLADQLTFISNHTPSPDIPKLRDPSLYRLHEGDGIRVWAIREPKFYNRGIRDHRILEKEAIARMERFDSYRTSSQQLSTDRYLLRHQPLVLLHIQDRSAAALELVKCLVKYSQDRVQMIDLPNW